MSCSVNITVCGLRWETPVSTGKAKKVPIVWPFTHPWWGTAAQVVSWAEHSPVMAGGHGGGECWGVGHSLGATAAGRAFLSCPNTVCLQQRGEVLLSPCVLNAKPLNLSSGWVEVTSHRISCIGWECYFTSFWCCLGLLEVRKQLLSSIFTLNKEPIVEQKNCKLVLSYCATPPKWLTPKSPIAAYIFFLSLKLSGWGDLPGGLLDNIFSESCSSLKSLMCDPTSVGGESINFRGEYQLKWTRFTSVVHRVLVLIHLEIKNAVLKVWVIFY